MCNNDKLIVKQKLNFYKQQNNKQKKVSDKRWYSRIMLLY